jgi:hypothetical protein
MPVISTANFTVTLPSGHKAVYAIEPGHVAKVAGPDANRKAIDYGTQVAHQLGHSWYKAGGWDEITDLRQIAALERCPDAQRVEDTHAANRVRRANQYGYEAGAGWGASTARNPYAEGCQEAAAWDAGFAQAGRAPL